MSRPRPRLFRAMGKAEPPQEIEINGRRYQWERTIKHDSWAATALYIQPPTIGNSCSSGQPGQQRVICKFNRIEPIFFLPTGWLGNWLAGREATMYEALGDLPDIPEGYREVYSHQRRLGNAVAHDYIEGHPLRWHDQVDDQFFENLHRMLLQIHQRGIAYVDLNKWENIIVDDSGKPHLIDFQISQRWPKVWPLTGWLRILQHCDLYHLSKHAYRIRPDLYQPDHFATRSWWIEVHRKIAQPLRNFRRNLLVKLGIRKAGGKPVSEAFVEDGLRPIGPGISIVEQLYQLFASSEYQHEAGRQGKKIAVAIFEDLMQRPVCEVTELPALLELSQKTIHDQIVWTLKSPTFLLETNGWEPAVLDSIICQIRQRLRSSRPLRQVG
jgi:hypothetical protein